MTTKKEYAIKFGFAGLLMPALTLLFAVAKIFGIYNMSWLWVFSPLWVPPVLFLGVVLTLGLAAAVIGAISFVVLLLIDIWAKRKARLDRERWRR